MAAQRRYSDDDKVAALASLDANGDNFKRTARETGIPRATLQGWRNGLKLGGAEVPSEVPTTARHQITNKDVEAAKESLARATEKVARSLVDSLVGKLPDASMRDAAVAFGILVDKMQLLRGEATSINEQRNAERLAEFRKRYGESNVGRNSGDDGR